MKFGQNQRIIDVRLRELSALQDVRLWRVYCTDCKWFSFLNDSLFQGCVALLRYSSASKPFENVKLLKSHVVGNCSGEPCTGKQNMCQHNGTCVDLVTRVECDCEETGYYGRYCEHSGM